MASSAPQRGKKGDGVFIAPAILIGPIVYVQPDQARSFAESLLHFARCENYQPGSNPGMRQGLRWSSSGRRAAGLGLLLLELLTLLPAHAATGFGYIHDIPPETPTARQLRHAKVAERRTGTMLIAHRGACTLAPENTLEACAAAMDYGADGCEIDIRRTTDGVLVLFHDDMLDRLTDGFGKVEDLSYAELLMLRPQLKEAMHNNMNNS